MRTRSGRFRCVVAGVAVTAMAVISDAASASADPGLMGAPLAIPHTALSGWKFSRFEGAALATAQMPNVAWKSAIDLGPVRGQAKISERSPIQDLARSIVAETVNPYSSGIDSRVGGITVSATTISGVPAARAVAMISVRNQPVRTLRLRVIVVDTNPRTYYRSRISDEAVRHTEQANAAEAGLTVVAAP